ncbi:MAG TPA: hypothetical protein VGJ25_02895 [Gaiellaceae bacterium]
METVRPRGARVASAALAAAVVGATAAWLAASAGNWGWPLGAVGAAAFLLAASRRSAALPWSLALLGAEYAAALEIAGRARADGRAPVVAAALVVAAGLSGWSRELEPEIRHERGLLSQRALRIALVGVGAAAVAAAVLGLAVAPLDAGVAGDALGVAAAVAAFAVLLAVRRGGSSP